MHFVLAALKRAVTQNESSLVRSLLEEVREKDRELQVRMGKRYDERKCFKVQLQMEVQKATRFLSDVERKQATTHGSTLNQSTTLISSSCSLQRAVVLQNSTEPS